MRRPAVLLLSALLLAGASACARHTQDSEVVEPAPEPVQVEMKNLFALPVEVFAFGGGSNFRLGVVHPGMTGHFKIPLNITRGGSTEFMLTTNSSATNPWKSGPMLLSPGVTVDIVAAQRLFSSTATIRP